MDSYIRAPGLVLYPYVFVVGPNTHDILSGILVRAETSSPINQDGRFIREQGPAGSTFRVKQRIPRKWFLYFIFIEATQ